MTKWRFELTSPASSVRHLTYCYISKVLKVSPDQWDKLLTSYTGSLTDIMPLAYYLLLTVYVIDMWSGDAVVEIGMSAVL